VPPREGYRLVVVVVVVEAYVARTGVWLLDPFDASE
jgi:hypothetical protein